MAAVCEKYGITPTELGELGMDTVCEKYGITPTELGEMAGLREEYRMQWKAMFGRLEQYRNKHGDCNVSINEEGLGRWGSAQSANFKMNRLLDERKEMLSSMGFCFFLDRDKEQGSIEVNLPTGGERKLMS